MDILHETETHLFWEEEGILCFKYKVPIIDIEVARNGLAVRNKITNNKPSLVYSDCSLVSNVTSEARAFYASQIGMKTTIAFATLSPTAISKILATFFLSFNRPKVPFKFFSTKEKAFKWLHEMGKNDQSINDQ